MTLAVQGQGHCVAIMRFQQNVQQNAIVWSKLLLPFANLPVFMLSEAFLKAYIKC